MERIKSYKRLSVLTLFRETAEESLTKFERLNHQVLELEEKISKVPFKLNDSIDIPPIEYEELDLESSEIEHERNKCYVTAIVFTAMYFEAFIYDYATYYLNDNYVKAHLDKMDFISKWLVIPKLITGKELSKGGQAYQALKRLHKERNRFVHYKSKDLSDADPEDLGNMQENEEKNIQQGVRNCRVALKHVFSELLEIDPENPLVQYKEEPNNNRID